jgi:hypothetical protein
VLFVSDRSYGNMRGQGPVRRRSEELLIRGAVYACTVTGRYQGHVWQRVPFPHLPTPIPSLRMPSVSSHAKHIFPSPPSPQMSTAASLSARRRLVVDVSQVASQRNTSVPNRADSVRAILYTALHQRLILSKLSSNTSTSSTLVDNAVRAILLRSVFIEQISAQEASMPVYLGDEHVMMQLNYMLVGGMVLTG